MFAHLIGKPLHSSRATVVQACALVVVCVSASFAQPVRFSLPSHVSGTAGEIIELPLHLDPAGHAVGSFDATLAFEHALLTYTGFSPGQVLAASNGWLIDVNGDNANGTVVIGAFSFAHVSGPGAAILLKFSVSTLAAGGDSARLTLFGLAATDTNATPLQAEGTAGNFTVKPVLSGRIRTTDGAALSGVTLMGLPGEPITDPLGYYRAALAPGWSGTMTPAKRGYTFEPPSRQYNLIRRDQAEQDFLGTDAGQESFAFPNPFNPEIETAQIRFALPHPARASVRILDGRGDIVREWVSAEPSRANVEQFIHWDGRNGRGELVAIGIYFYIIEAHANSRMAGKIGVTR